MGHIVPSVFRSVLGFSGDYCLKIVHMCGPQILLSPWMRGFLLFVCLRMQWLSHSFKSGLGQK